jgi:hypothetical protein
MKKMKRVKVKETKRLIKKKVKKLSLNLVKHQMEDYFTTLVQFKNSDIRLLKLMMTRLKFSKMG